MLPMTTGQNRPPITNLVLVKTRRSSVSLFYLGISGGHIYGRLPQARQVTQ